MDKMSRDFDLDQLRTLVAVADDGSVTAGAVRVHLSQSAASEQLRKLEERCGQALLIRSRAGVSPTSAGERLLAHARRLLALSEDAWRDMHGTQLQGELRLGVTDYFRTGELAGLLTRVRAQHPRLRLHVQVRGSDDLSQAIERGELDLALVMRIGGTDPEEGRRAGKRAGKRTADHAGSDAESRAESTAESRAKSSARSSAKSSTGTAGVVARTLRREPLRWVGAPGLRHVRGQTVGLVALTDTCVLHCFTVGLLERRRIPHDFLHVASGVGGLQSALAAGLGIACLNESAMCAGVAPLAAPHGLPALPRVAFTLLSRPAGDPAFVAQVADVLVQGFEH